MSKAPFILLINPWVTDFAAHDLWSKPLGLLMLGALLRQGGCGVGLIDCLDRYDSETHKHPGVIAAQDRHYGTGKYPRMRIAKPEAYQAIPRHYYRFGIHPDILRRRLTAFPSPTLICVTSLMTYWYPGVQQTIAVVREVFPTVPVWLGGIYPQLCPQHARLTSGADEVIVEPISILPARIAAATRFTLSNHQAWQSFPNYPPPALDLLPVLGYGPLLTSRGCPFSCPYCASGSLFRGWERRSGELIYNEIVHLHEQRGIVDFAFYDDALLIDAQSTLKPALQALCERGLRLRFHTPNALHIRALTPAWCELLHESGFTTLRLGLETTQPHLHRAWGNKVGTEMFYAALTNLLSAGFRAARIGVYLLAGLPGQSPEEVADSIRVVEQAGAQPYLAEYSPIPGTALWPDAIALSSFDLASDPLYHNNTFFACRRDSFSYNDLVHLKELARRARQSRAG